MARYGLIVLKAFLNPNKLINHTIIVSTIRYETWVRNHYIMLCLTMNYTKTENVWLPQFVESLQDSTVLHHRTWSRYRSLLRSLYWTAIDSIGLEMRLCHHRIVLSIFTVQCYVCVVCVDRMSMTMRHNSRNRHTRLCSTPTALQVCHIYLLRVHDWHTHTHTHTHTRTTLSIDRSCQRWVRWWA